MEYTKSIIKNKKTSQREIFSWFNKNNWTPFPFQQKTWKLYNDGKSGLIHASTGTGKTYAAFLGPVIEYLNSNSHNKNNSIKVLWLTPLRALAEDTLQALQKPLTDLNISWKVEKRTGDTSSYTKKKQLQKLPPVLVTTPESLSILLSYEGSTEQLKGLQCVIVDEWHELISSKRGVLTELLLARLKNLAPSIRIWGLSATLGNINEALEILLGTGAVKGEIIQGHIPKKITLKTIIPEVVEKFPWAGHMGTSLINEVIREIEEAESTLVFTNTRSQTEIWFQSILDLKPDWAGLIAVHHGSIDNEQRNVVEDFLRKGKMKCVVCTSSLDLGVDFSPVDKIIQIGSPKGIARILQRAGRSGHNPGRESLITCVPSNSFDIIEFAAVRSAMGKGFIEPRHSIKNPLDVLSQHLVTIAAGEGFNRSSMFEEVRTTYAYKNLSLEEYSWVLNFITKGGPALRAYPEYSKVSVKDDFYKMENKQAARRHRMSIGTITGDSSVLIQFMRGDRLGTIEESFIAKLKRGDVFTFGGRNLEYVRIKDMTVYVRSAKNTKGIVPQWWGGRLPLSSELASEVRLKFNEALNHEFIYPEMEALKGLLELQYRWSALPAINEVLVEKIKTREGYHLFLYPFEGKLVHEGLASLAAFRISRTIPVTFSISTNDYGFELLTSYDLSVTQEFLRTIFSPVNLLDDILESLNSTEMARRQFRDIARIAGLIFQSYPGSKIPMRHLQASSSLFYEVFKKYDPENLLIKQATKEVLEKQLEETRLAKTLNRMMESSFLIKEPSHPTPLAFPIMINRFREMVSSEKLSDRIKKMQISLEKAALRVPKRIRD